MEGNRLQAARLRWPVARQSIMSGLRHIYRFAGISSQVGFVALTQVERVLAGNDPLSFIQCRLCWRFTGK
jgi:hypothetical protein